MFKVEQLLSRIRIPESNNKSERLLKIAEDARANGIPLAISDFGFDPESGQRTKNISPTAIRDLVKNGRESGLLSEDEIDYLNNAARKLTPKAS